LDATSDKKENKKRNIILMIKQRFFNYYMEGIIIWGKDITTMI